MPHSSSSDEDSSPKKPKNSSSSSSAAVGTNSQQYPPGPYPPGGNNPQTMGYPPYMGYPPPGQPGPYQHPNQYPPPPQQGYNYNYPHYNYPTQAPPAAYYNNNYPTQQELEAAAGFARGFLIGMMLLFLFIFLSTIIMWVVLRPEVPEFKVESLSVTNFNAKPNTFAGDWGANVTARNPNTKIRLFFNQIETFMFFGDEELASSYANPFTLDIGAEAPFMAKMAANRSADGGEEEGEAMQKMTEEFGKGAVEFSLRMAAWTTFRSDSWWTRRSMVRIFCEELKVGFVGKSGNGSLVPGGNRDCLVFV